MVILGIETSCDETAAAIVKDGREILSSVIATSSEMHKKTGGIIPEQAAREQVKSIIPVIEESIKSTKSIDAIAVTVGPGLIGSLLVGVETAKTLAWVWDKPIVPVNHLVGHIYANWLENTPPNLPAVVLVVSGGHTDLVLMNAHGELNWVGGTRDDAAGEAFDKTARLLGLKYPGGPEISRMAQQNVKREGGLDANALKQLRLPRPLINEDNFDFSFSGLKTAVLREVQKTPVSQLSNGLVAQLAWQVQEAITDVLVAKTLRAVKECNVPTLLLAGGVAANQRLREKFQLETGNWKLKIDFRVPPPHLCTDNASFVAAFAEYNFHPVPWQKIAANPSLTIT